MRTKFEARVELSPKAYEEGATSGIGPRQASATSRQVALGVRAEETGATREPDIDQQSGANMSSPAPFRSAPELVELSEVLGTRSQVLAALKLQDAQRGKSARRSANLATKAAKTAAAEASPAPATAAPAPML